MREYEATPIPIFSLISDMRL